MPSQIVSIAPETLLNALDTQIAVIDSMGQLVYVNQTWVEIGQCNGMPKDYDWLQQNYLQVCHAAAENGDQYGMLAISGISNTIKHMTPSFEMLYPCMHQEQNQWFKMRVVPLTGTANDLFLITHQNVTAQKMELEKLERLSLLDPLTGLANRRRFDQFLRTEWQRATRHQLPIALMMIDIDHFKNYNDNLGHLQGDQCLIAVSNELGQFAKRSSDIAARLGGEEFVILLADTPLHTSRQIAESVRRTIENLKIQNPRLGYLTISIGLAHMTPIIGQPEQDLIAAADKALYEAKQSGRNCVCLAPLQSGMHAVALDRIKNSAP